MTHATHPRVIDFHAHVVHPDVYAQTVNHNVVGGFGLRPMEERPLPASPRWKLFSMMALPQVQLADMDKRGVDHAVISASTVSQSTFYADAGLAAALDRVGADADCFSPAAVETLARFAAGVPRTACHLARLAALAAAGEGLDRVEAGTIERAWRELVPGDEPPAAAGHAMAPATTTASPIRVVRQLWG